VGCWRSTWGWVPAHSKRRRPRPPLPGNRGLRSVGLSEDQLRGRDQRPIAYPLPLQREDPDRPAGRLTPTPTAGSPRSEAEVVRGRRSRRRRRVAAGRRKRYSSCTPRRPSTDCRSRGGTEMGVGQSRRRRNPSRRNANRVRSHSDSNTALPSPLIAGSPYRLTLTAVPGHRKPRAHPRRERRRRSAIRIRDASFTPSVGTREVDRTTLSVIAPVHGSSSYPPVWRAGYASARVSGAGKNRRGPTAPR